MYVYSARLLDGKTSVCCMVDNNSYCMAQNF